MHTLSELQYQIEAEPILRRVFVDNDPFGEPFSSNVVERVIVYRCDIYIEPPLLDGLIAGALSLGDTGCYLTRLWRDEKEPNHFYIPLSELREGYVGPSDKVIEAQLDINFWSSEYVIYSAQGTWGLMVSHEHHGMLGGLPGFLKAVREVVPDLNMQIYYMLESFQLSLATGSYLTLGWLPGLLKHVYGQEVAQRMLQETGLPSEVLSAYTTRYGVWHREQP